MFLVSEVVPHTGRMLLIDKVIDCGEDWLMAEVIITTESLFCEDGGVPAIVGIEYMAQTIAAYAGINGKKHNKKPTIGLLLGTRKYDSTVDYFSIGSKLNIHIRQKYNDESGLGAFMCTITAEHIKVDAQISVYHPEDISTLITDNHNQ